MTDATDARLAAQYEAFPYPKRDPRDEARRLIIGSPSHLREIDHWVFGAARPASRPLRALVAGGGTGDGAIMLAQQMATAGRPGRVSYLDRSAAAHGVARARAEARGLTLDWHTGSLLDLPGSGLGQPAGGAAAVEPGDAAGAPGPGHLLRQHHGAVAAAAAGEQRMQRPAGRAAGAEDPVVDLPQVARAADDQPLRLPPRVAGGIGKGLVRGGEGAIGGIGHGRMA